MRMFLKRVLFFFLPLSIVFLFPLFVLFQSGEFLSTSKILEKENISGEHVLLGKAYVPVPNDFIFRSIEQKKPQVLAVGNSRVLEFRQEFFNEGVSFFNAGSTILHTGDLNRFLDHLSYNPQVIVLGLEQSYFHPMWNENNMTSIEPSDSSLNSEAVLNILKKVFLDFFHKKFTLSALFKKNTHYQAIGLNAVVNENGSRNDGSHYYGKIIKNPQDITAEDYQFKDTFDRIEKGERRFEHAQAISSQAVRQLEIFLEACKKRNISVIAFLPPYAPSVWNKMHDEQNKNNYLYISQIEPRLRPLFEKYHFVLRDFSDMSSVTHDTDFVDGFHGGEKVYARLVGQMASSSAVVAQVFNMKELGAKISDSSLILAIFPD